MSQIPFEQRAHQDSNEADPIHENIQDIVELHKRAENEVSKQQRIIEDMTDFLGRPRFLFVIIAFVALWILVNALLIKFGLPNFDLDQKMSKMLTLVDQLRQTHPNLETGADPEVEALKISRWKSRACNWCQCLGKAWYCPSRNDNCLLNNCSSP